MVDPAPADPSVGPPVGHPMSTTRVLVPIAAATTVSVLPAFLLGSQGVQLQQELDFDSFGLGVAIALAWIAASLSSAPLGRFSERIGGATALRLAAGSSGLAMFGIAAFAHSWAFLAAGAVVGGVANALAQPSANLLITRLVGDTRHGVAFAVKQSAIPLATLLGGLAVPLLTLSLGWRSTFVAGGLLAVAAALGVPVQTERRLVARPPTTESPPDDGRRAGSVLKSRKGPLIILSVGVGLGASAAGGLTGFLTSGAVAAGIEPGRAGLLLAAGSAIGIASRISMGARADRIGTDQLPVVTLMMVVGALGYSLMALQHANAYVLATPLAFGAGWAWPGLFNLSVVRDYPEAPGAATGITQTGTYLGAALGPLAFGVIVSHGTYAPAWLLGASCLLLGSLAMIAGNRALERAR